MANETTLENLKDRALDYADMTGSGFPDDDRLTDYINSGLSELHDLIVANHGEDYLRKDTTFAVSSSSESYTLPSDFYKALAVFHQSSGRRHKVERWQPSEISGARTTPLSSGTVELWYVPQHKKLAQRFDTVSIAIPVGWEDFVSLHAAARLLMREESDASAIVSERERQRARIVAMLGPRDVAEPDSIGDHYGRWDYGVSSLAIEPSYKYRIMGNSIYFIELEFSGA